MTLSFKEYLESRKQLIEAASGIPQATVKYSPKKYCSLQLTEQEQLHTLGIKPRHEIIVEWRYENINLPTIVNCTVKINGEIVQKGIPNLDSLKFQKWLQRNTEAIS